MDINNNRNDEEPKKNNRPNPEIYTIIAIVLCVFVCICLFTNGLIFGTMGNAIVKFILGIFGYAAYAIFLGAFVFSIFKLLKKKIKLSKKHVIAFILLISTGILSIHLFTTKDLITSNGYGQYLGRCYTGAVRGFSTTTGGGILAGLIVYPLAKVLSTIGASIIFILAFLTAAFIACDFIFLRRKKTRRMDVSEYREYPVDRPEANSGGYRANPYADYRNSARLQPPQQQMHTGYDLEVKPVQRKLYIGTVNGDDRQADDFATKSKKEMKNSKSQENGLNVLYDNSAAINNVTDRKVDKMTAMNMLFGATGGMQERYDEIEPKVIKHPVNGQSYLDRYEQHPINDIKDPKALRDYILNPPSVTEMYPGLGGERGVPQQDPNRPTKIVHDKPEYRQISLDEAFRGRDGFGGDIPKRSRREGNMYDVPDKNTASGYEDYLNRKVTPHEAPPIINGEEFTKNVIKNSERGREEEPLAPIVSSYDELMERERQQRDPRAVQLQANEPTDKVVDFKSYSVKHAVPKLSKKAEQDQPLIKPVQPIVEQIAIPPTHLTPPARTYEPEAEPTIDERAAQAAAAVKKPPRPKIRYNGPPIDLIKPRPMDLDSISDSYNEKAHILEDTLDEFKVPAKVASIVKGPTVTRYELEMPRGIPVKRVLNVADDLAMRLESENGLRIEAPIPGKNRLGIEVPNTKKLMVGLREVLDTQDFCNNTSPLSFAVGKDVAGKNIICDLAKMPHLLVAGSTGAGKSVCLNTLIISLLYKSSPDDVRIILIDPKQVEFNTYNEMPHLMLREVISSPEKAISALNWAIIEMERRYTLFKAMNVVKLGDYKEKYDPELDEKLPNIVIIVDELADLMATNKREVEEKIQRLVQKSRAAGIHLVLATQRPSVDIITGVIKNNLPSRIAFKVVSFQDSKTILDASGAENLLGMGDMLYKPATAPEPVRLQGAFISMDEVDTIVRYIKENNSCEFDETVEQSINKPKVDAIDNNDAGDDPRDRGDDPLFVDALRLIMDTKQASISYLQRKFSIGYARAGKLIDEMETRGYISPSDGSKARQVYITPQQFAELYGELDG